MCDYRGKGPDTMNWTSDLMQVIVNGLLMGMVYSLIATGLTLIWGVMDLANFAHGEFLMLGMYFAYWMSTIFQMDPFTSLPLAAILFFVAGQGVYRIAVKPVMKSSDLSRILVTFGLGIIISNVALFLWTPNFRSVSDTVLKGTVTLGGLRLPVAKIAASCASLMASLGLYLFLLKTRIGRALQAVSMDPEAAVLVGIDSEKMFAIAFGLGIGCAGVAGCVLANFSYVSPTVGSVFSLLAFASVALGGFGSVPGALLGALIIGLAEALGGFLIGPAYKYVVVFGIYLLVIIARPKGLMGW
jgi:branched-chain amino acid transport system permease protein